MKKITKLLIGCLILLILFCLLSICLTFVFWKKIYDFVEPFLSSAGIDVSSVSVFVLEKIFNIVRI